MKATNPTVLCTAAFLVLAASGAARAPRVEGDAAGSAPAVHVDPAIDCALEQGAVSTHVVVMLEPVPPRGRSDLARQMREVSDVQERVLASVTSAEFRIAYRYRTFAALTGWIDARGLEVLRQHPDVRSITPDSRGSAALDFSRTFIGADLVQQVGVTGAGTTVAVLDSGIDTDHPDLLDDIAPGAMHFLSQGLNVGPGAEDNDGHGTRVSGVITSAGVVAPLGIAPDAEILPVKVISGGSGWLSDWAAGVDYVVSVSGNYANLVAINMSLVSGTLYTACPCDTKTPSLAASTAAAKAAEIAVVAASGNEGSCTQMASPACLSSVVSVAATYDGWYGREPNSGNYGAGCFDPDSQPDWLTCFSNRNACTDVADPGRYIESSNVGGGTWFGTGTSFSSPHVAAVAALLGEVVSLSPDQLLQVLKDTGEATIDTYCSSPVEPPRVDARAALCAVAPQLFPNVVRGLHKISQTSGGFAGSLADVDEFGTSVASPGDLDGDGIPELIVGAPGDDDGGTNRGAVWVLFLHADGSVASEQKISQTAGGFAGQLADFDLFGISLAALGDANGDGRPEVAVAAFGDDTGGAGRGAVWILSLLSDGTVATALKIADGLSGFGPVLNDGDAFGISCTALPDLDGNGTRDLAVGAQGDDDGGAERGAVWILFLDSGLGVVAQQKISATQGGFTGPLADLDLFGRSLALLGDLDGGGSPELAVGAFEDDDGGANRGAVWILSLSAAGLVTSEQKISATAGGFTGPLDDGDRLGAALAGGTDLDGDGVADLLAGAVVDDDGGWQRGAVWILHLNPDGTVKTERKLSSLQCGLGAGLDVEDRFGRSIALLGGSASRLLPDLGVGAFRVDDGGTDRGSVWLATLAAKRTRWTRGLAPEPAGTIQPFAVERPTVRTVARPLVGGTLELEVTGVPAGADAVLLVGQRVAAVRAGHPGGRVRFELSIPNDPALAGAALPVQAVVYPGGRPLCGPVVDVRIEGD